MRRTLGVGIVLLLLALLSPDGVLGQTSGRGSRLRGNYPNPFNPETTIPFDLYDTDFRSGQPAVVTIRIHNIFKQLVAIPTALHHPNGNVLVERLPYTTPGKWEAFWNGTDVKGRKVASGIYYVVLTVNGVGERPRQIVVSK